MGQVGLIRGSIGGNVYHAEKGTKRSSNIILRMVPFYA